jgi:hypothetical protein
MPQYLPTPMPPQALDSFCLALLVGPVAGQALRRGGVDLGHALMLGHVPGQVFVVLGLAAQAAVGADREALAVGLQRLVAGRAVCTGRLQAPGGGLVRGRDPLVLVAVLGAVGIALALGQGRAGQRQRDGCEQSGQDFHLQASSSCWGGM